MDLPEMLPDETCGDYRARCNFPHVFVPYSRGSDSPYPWQQELMDKFPTISLMPYETLQVSKGLETVCVVFEDLSHITELSREVIVHYCCSYGREHAEKTIPSVENLRALYTSAVNERLQRQSQSTDEPKEPKIIKWRAEPEKTRQIRIDEKANASLERITHQAGKTKSQCASIIIEMFADILTRIDDGASLYIESGGKRTELLLPLTKGTRNAD